MIAGIDKKILNTIRRFTANYYYGMKSWLGEITVFFGIWLLKCQDFIPVLESAIMCYAYQDFCVLKLSVSRVQRLAHMIHYVWKMESKNPQY